MPETALIERYRSLGRALDPYKRPPPPQNIASWFTGDGWRERSKRLTNTFQNGNTIVHLWRKLPGFGIGAFKAEALGIYCSVHRAMAEGDVKSVQDLLTDNMLISLQNETAQRLKRGVPPLIWRTDFEAQGVDVAQAAGTVASVVHGRLIPIVGQRDDTVFAQLTVLVKCKHRVLPAPEATAKHAPKPGGKAKAKAAPPPPPPPSSAEAASAAAVEVAVEDHWVFEAPVGQAVRTPTSRWRLVDRLAGV